MNKYCTLFSTLLCFVSIRRYATRNVIMVAGKVSTVTTTNETEIIGCCHPRELGQILLLFRIGSVTTSRFTEGEELLLFDFLTNTSHYDTRQAPTCSDGTPQSPLVVRTSMFVYFIGNFDAQNLEFETHLLFRHRWRVSDDDGSLENDIYT